VRGAVSQGMELLCLVAGVRGVGPGIMAERVRGLRRVWREKMEITGDGRTLNPVLQKPKEGLRGGLAVGLNRPCRSLTRIWCV